jgi:hypothetical protein
MTYEVLDDKFDARLVPLHPPASMASARIHKGSQIVPVNTTETDIEFTFEKKRYSVSKAEWNDANVRKMS